MKSPLFIELLRHGEVLGGERVCGRHDEALLSERGWRQLRARLHEKNKWDTVISSPLPRCAAFAKEVALQCGIPLQLNDALAEFDFGAWSGIPSAKLWQDAPKEVLKFFTDPLLITPPGGEAFSAFQFRVLKAWEEICQNYPGEYLLILSHSLVMRVIFAAVLAMPTTALFKFDVPHACLIRFAVYRSDKAPIHYSLSAYLPCLSE